MEFTNGVKSYELDGKLCDPSVFLYASLLHTLKDHFVLIVQLPLPIVLALQKARVQDLGRFHPVPA